ncbi:MAG: hypothetical protein WBY88_14560 [Desulfosarcina sp.]
MRLKKGGRQALIGLWILAGLLVAGFNAYAIITLLDTPLSGYSDDVRTVERGMQQCRLLLATAIQKNRSEMAAVAERFPSKTVKHDPIARKPVVSAPVKKSSGEASTRLPCLAGILIRRTADGIVNRLALLDGRPLSEGDTIADFSLRQISDRGVMLARGGRIFFIEAPRVSHSLTTR